MHKLLAFTFSLLVALPALASADSWHYKKYTKYPQWKSEGRYGNTVYYYPNTSPFYRGNSAPYPFHYNNQYNSYYSPSDWRIQDGIRSGRLSSNEVRELRDEQSDLRRLENAYRRDGFLSRHESEELSDERRDYERKLSHELNDGEKRYW